MAWPLFTMSAKNVQQQLLSSGHAAFCFFMLLLCTVQKFVTGARVLTILMTMRVASVAILAVPADHNHKE